MKNISKYWGAALLLFTTACSQTQESSFYTPNRDDAKEIHFIQSSIEKEFPQDTRSGIIDVEIARTGNKGTYTVKLIQRGDDAGLFNIPDEATILDGEYAVTVPVEVNLSAGTPGSTFKTTLYIAEREVSLGDGSAQVSQYTDKVSLAASFELEWETLHRTNAAGEQVPQLATYHYNLYYTGRDSGLEVEKAVGTNIYRLKEWASGVTFKFIVHDDNTCTVPAQSIGYFNSNYNEYVYVADMAVYTGNDAAYASYPCTFDGKDTFSFYLIYYVSAGYFSQGEEKIVFDSDPDTTPVVAIAYDGIQTTTTGFQAPQLSFLPNSYTKFYKATVVAGDITTDATRQEEVRQQLIEDKLAAVTPVVTRYEADQSIWNVPKGNYTAVALAYDSIENPCKLYTQRFTCDIAGEYGVKVHDFEFYAPEDNPNYSPYSSLVWEMQASNVASAKYLCVTADIADYLTENLGQTLEELTAERGNAVNEEFVANLNSEEGIATAFTSLDQGTSYVLAVLMTNQFGDTEFISKTATTKGYFAKDFDQTKTLEDFLGAFSVSATVTTGSNDTQTSFRMDISRMNDRDVAITGMSDMRDFAPTIFGYYDSERHMIVVDPQSAGSYGVNYATLGFSDGLSIYWGGNSMAIGYIGDKLYWAASPYATANVTSYMFLLFSSPEASSSTYLREYVGSKSYSAISMIPLKLAPQNEVPTSIERQVETLEVNGLRFKSHLVDFDPTGPASEVLGHKAAAPVSEQFVGKRLRTDLTLRQL